MNESILKRFVLGTLFTGTGRIFIIVIGLLGFMLTARWLTIEELGMFTLLQVSVGFIIKFSDLGIGTSITKFIASNDDFYVKNKLISTAFYARIFTLVAASIVALIARQLLFKLFGSSLYFDLLIFIPILVGIEGIMLLINSIYEGLFQFKIVGIADALFSISSLVGILILVVWQEQGLMGRIYARIFAVVFILLFHILANRFRAKLIFSWTLLKDMLKFGFPLYINQMLTFIFLRADTVIIGSFLGPSKIAIYEIARRIPESLEMLYDAFRKVYFPFISKLSSEGQHEKCSQILNVSLRLTALMGSLGTLGIFLFGEEIILLLFSEKYLPSVPVFSILMIGLIFLIIDYTLGYTLVAIGESNKPPIINTIHTVVNFLGYFILIPAFGMNGAAIASIIGTASVNPLNVLFLKRKRIHTDYSSYIKPLIILGSFLILIFLFNPAHILLKIAIVISFLIFNFLFSVVTKEDFSLAIRFMQPYASKLVQLWKSKRVSNGK